MPSYRGSKWRRDNRVHVPFSLTHLAHCRQKLGRLSEEPSTFLEEFHALTVVSDLTWMDVQVVLSACCAPKEKQGMWTAARGMLTNPNIML